MARYASGKKAWGFSDRSGFRYRLSEMITEWNGMKVGPDEYEPKHPQLIQTHTGSDPQALFEPRPRNDTIPVTVRFPSFSTETFEYALIPVAVGLIGDVTFGGDVHTPVTSNITGVSGTGSVGTVTASGTGSAIAATYTVTVVSGNPVNHPYYNVGSSNKFAINGSTATSDVLLSLSEGSTYKFDQSDSSNSGHPLRFSTTANGSHGGGSEYTTGVTTNGTPGSAGAYTQITVASGAPTLYYYCTNHSGMGWQANTP
jgi:hypothetical protein|tara:strand:+ start:952 stop:1722 length:771 start_codon:yes stop_codon:yes gene_type:complete